VGLATRLMAFNLFVFNIIAVVSYPVIWQGGPNQVAHYFH
jgi:uncharacterized membrane protein YphA (DoxX/SURF4 family)